nr:hypothetical protein [Indioceanicola profundi]
MPQQKSMQFPSEIQDPTLQVSDNIIDISARAFPKVAIGVQDLNVCKLIAATQRPRNHMVNVVRPVV